MNWIDRALQKAQAKVDRTLTEVGDNFPHVSDGDLWITSPVTGWEDTYSDWTAGFWPGILWLMFEATQDSCYREGAFYYTRVLENRLTYDSHDLGFLFYPSCVRGFELTQDPMLREWALQAADRLVGLFNPAAKLLSLRGGGESQSYAAIDTMMNLPLLWWAHHETSQDRYLDVAFSHALSSARHFVRGDGSTYHVLRFSPDTGEVIWRGTKQGYSESSCWSRGHAWALCGFVIANVESGRSDLDSTIDALYCYVRQHLPSDLVPYWDFDAPGAPNTWRDSSAAAIMASALLQWPVSHHSATVEEAHIQLGLKMLRSLVENYSVDTDASEPGLLRHGCFHAPRKVATDNSLIWGDYFYLSALLALRHLRESAQ